MRLRVLLLIAALAAPTLTVATRASANEKDEQVVKLSDIPAAARKGLEREAKGAPITMVELEHEHGRTLYEGHVKEKQGVVGIVVDANGKLVGRHSEAAEHEHEHEHEHE